MSTNRIFKHVYGGMELRTFLDEQNAPWFLAKDVCGGLGLNGHVSHTCSKLCDFERKNVVQNAIITPEMLKAAGISLRGKAPLLITESGLYKLVMRSDKPEAAKFQQWVCGEVLPEIRRTGSYEAGADAPEIIKAVADAINPLDLTFAEAKEYCQLRNIPEEAKNFLGKIASRLCIEQNKPKRWTNFDKKTVKKYKLKFRSVGQYPLPVLDEAYALYEQGVRE